MKIKFKNISGIALTQTGVSNIINPMTDINEFVLLFLVAGAVSATASAFGAQPPKVMKKPHKLEKHGHVRIDDYYWLKERENPEAIQYLKDENAYTEAVMKHTEKFQDELFKEIKSRIKEDDSTPPFKDGPYYYYARYETGGEYPIYCRKKGSLEAKEEILLNVNEMAKGHAFYHARLPVASPDHKVIAFAVDAVGRRFYTIYFKDLESGKILDEKIPDVAGNMVWANDNKTVFYTKQHPETLRWEKIYKYVLGSEKHEEMYFEKDDTFSVSLAKTRTNKYILMPVNSTLTTEYRYLKADEPESGFKIFHPRQHGLEYYLEHGGDVFYVMNNENAKNFKISVAEEDKTGKAVWKDYIAHRDDVLIEDVDAFRDWLVVSERKDGLQMIRVINRKTEEEHYLEFRDPAYLVYAGTNEEYETDWLRFNYESLTTPDSVYDYNMKTKEKNLVKRQEVLGDFNPDNYVSERLWSPARDGKKIPVSIVYRKEFRKDGSPMRMHITSYGSYGASSDPYFSSVRLSLLDRGFVCAIPHIRGGSELGRQWYEDGRQKQKKNTFYDFIDATKFLVDKKYALSGHVYAEGGSAGGLLMGAVSNLAPQLYNGIIAEVPFVDVVNTMLDPDIPLTTSEYDEWGDPNKKDDYEYMLSYSPYDNVEKKAYPNMLITAGLHDSQVQYWEPAKWTAKLRDLKTGDNKIILKTDMEVGHSGKTGRFESLKLIAFEYAFIFNLEGISK